MKIFNSLFYAFVIVFPYYIISLYIAMMPKMKEKAIRKIITEGQMVTAVLKKTNTLLSGMPGVYSRGSYRSVYKFKYKNRYYKYITHSDYAPSKTIKLYFLRNPRKAVSDASVINSRFPWKIYFYVVILLYLLA